MSLGKEAWVVGPSGETGNATVTAVDDLRAEHARDLMLVEAYLLNEVYDGEVVMLGHLVEHGEHLVTDRKAINTLTSRLNIVLWVCIAQSFAILSLIVAYNVRVLT